MGSILSLVIPFFGLIFLGLLAAKLVNHHERGMDWLNTFVIYFALPALLYKLLSRTPFEELINVSFILSTLSATISIFSLTVILSKFIGRATLAESAIRGAAASYGNVGYMGPGLALAAFGSQAAVPIALILCFDNLFFFIIVPLLAVLSGKQRTSLQVTVSDIAKKVLLHPFIIASFAGITAAYFQLTPPDPVAKLLDYLSSAAAPCALFALGVTLGGQSLKRLPVEMPLILIAKLILQPLLAYFIVSTFADPPKIWLLTAILMASLPTAANVFLLASQYKQYVERASSTIFISTIISVLTVTGILYLIEQGILP